MTCLTVTYANLTKYLNISSYQPKYFTITRADAFKFYLARPVPLGLTLRSASSDTPPLYDDIFIPYAGGRRIPGAGEYRIEMDRVP